jgi:hypothetical protein
MKNQIDKVLGEGKLVLDCYKRFNCPTEGDQYKLFVFEAIKIMREDPQFDWFVCFLLNNEGNNLPKQSSGSLFTALSDKDNFANALNIEDQDDDIIDYFDLTFDKLFN